MAVLSKIGPQRLLSRFRAAGVPLPQADNEAGLAIALGGGGFSLFELVTLYAGLASKGYVLPLCVTGGRASLSVVRRQQSHCRAHT